MPRRPQKRTAERRRQRPQSPIAIDPLVGPGNPPHRHPPCAKTDQPRSRRCMVHLATRTSSHRSKSSYQAKYATVMLGLTKTTVLREKYDCLSPFAMAKGARIKAKRRPAG